MPSRFIHNYIRRIYIHRHIHSSPLCPLCPLRITVGRVAYTFRILAIGLGKGIAFNLALAASTGNDKHFVQTFDKHSLFGLVPPSARNTTLSCFGKQHTAEKRRDARARKRREDAGRGERERDAFATVRSSGCIPWGVRSPRRPLYSLTLFSNPPFFHGFGIYYTIPSPFRKVCVIHSFSQLTHRASDLCSYCPVRGIVSPLFIVHLCVIFPPWLGSLGFYLFATRPRFLMFAGLKGIRVLQ